MTYDIKNNYSLGTAVSPSDLNRRADVLQSQLPGALRGLGAGILGRDDLLVTNQIAAGSALIESGDGTLIYVEVPDALPIPARDEGDLYLHLALRLPDELEIGGPDDTMGTDSRRGAPPVPFWSDSDEEPDALLLARWEDGALQDARPKSQIVGLLARVEQVEHDLGYEVADRAKGTVASRLNNLLDTSGSGSSNGEVTWAQFKLLSDQVDALKANIDALGAKIGITGASALVDDVDRYLVRDVARLEVQATLQSPPFSLQTDASIVVGGVAGDGYELRKGLLSRDVHSGNTHLDVVSGEES